MSSLTWVVLDFETASQCDLEACGGYRYAEDVTTEILCCNFGERGGSNTVKRWMPAHGVDSELYELACDDNVTFVAHNASFEKCIWRAIMIPMFGFPDIKNSRWHCSLAMCAMRAIPQDLDRAVRVLKLPHEKQKFNVLALSKFDKSGNYNRGVEVLGQTYSYCDDDVRAQTGLHQRLGFLPPGERRVWLLDQRINERGVRLDLDFVRQAQRVVDDAIPPLAEEFRKITGLNVTQNVKILKWCQDRGTAITSLNKETLTPLLEEDDEDGSSFSDQNDIEAGTERVRISDEVHRALSIRSLIGSASVKKLRRMENCVGYDGRARGLLQYHGATPGRWAGRLLQPQNFPRGTIKLGDRAPDPDIIVGAIMTGDADYVEMVLGPPVECVVSALRHAIIADPGRILIAGDFSGIEARIVLALAGQTDKTALMASGADVYCDMASAIHKRPIDKVRDPEERQGGKNAVLGLGFQMGWRKFKLRYAKNMSDEFCQNVVNTYRREWAPAVPDLWQALQDASLAAVRDGHAHEAYGVMYQREDLWLTARLPSGRKLWYFNPQLVRRAMPWDPLDIREAWTYQAMKMGQWRTIDAFGGLETENAVQAIARDIMVGAMFRLEANNFPIVLTVHDEILAEPWEKDADAVAYEQIMCDVEPWVRELQIPIAVGKPMVGPRYRK